MQTWKGSISRGSIKGCDLRDAIWGAMLFLGVRFAPLCTFKGCDKSNPSENLRLWPAQLENLSFIHPFLGGIHPLLGGIVGIKY